MTTILTPCVPIVLSLQHLIIPSASGLFLAPGRLQLSALASELAEHFAEGGNAFAERIEIAFWYQENLHSGAGLNGGVARFVGEERHFSEVIAGAQCGHGVGAAVFVLDDVALALFDDVDAVAEVALMEDN